MNRPKTLGQCVGTFRTVFGEFGPEFQTKCPCVPLIGVMDKMNNGIGCVLPQRKCLVAI